MTERCAALSATRRCAQASLPPGSPGKAVMQQLGAEWRAHKSAGQQGAAQQPEPARSRLGGALEADQAASEDRPVAALSSVFDQLRMAA